MYHEIALKELLWIFTINSLVIFFVISTLISFFSNEKSFQYYSLFIFFITLYIYTKSPFNFLLISKYENSNLYLLNWYLQILFNLSYLVFITEFINLKSYNLNLSKLIITTSYLVLLTFTSLFVFCLVIENQQLFVNAFLFLFTPSFILLLLYTLYNISFIEKKLKYLIYTGIISYSILVSYAFYLSFYSHHIVFFKNIADPISIGLFLEGLIFSFGLGYKIKMIHNQEITAKKRIILLQNNEKLIKEEHQKYLERQLQIREKELLYISQNAEKEKLDILTDLYEGRLALLQLKTLSNQMNPHFIFNALNSIKAYLIVNDQKNAVYYLSQFSKLIRHILESLREEYITLKEELSIIKIYINLENMRFAYSIDFKLSVSDDVNIEQIQIPTLILQPFIENALVHGLLPKSGERLLRVDIYKRDDDIVINIVDNGIGREASDRRKNHKVFKKKSIGLNITNERLNLHNKRHNHLIQYTIEDLKEDGNAVGTKVCITISENKT